MRLDLHCHALAFGACASAAVNLLLDLLHDDVIEQLRAELGGIDTREAAALQVLLDRLKLLLPVRVSSTEQLVANSRLAWKCLVVQ